MKWWPDDPGFKLFRLEMISSVIGALISILLAKLWGTDWQGAWSVLNNFSSTVVVICTAGLPPVLISLIRREGVHEPAMIRRFVYYFIFLFTLSIVALNFISKTPDLAFLTSDIIQSGGGFVLLSIQIVLMVMINVAGAWMDAKNKQAYWTALRLTMNIILAIAIVMIYFLYRESPAVFLRMAWYAFILHALITCLWLMFHLSGDRLVKMESNGNTHTILNMISQGGWIYLITDLFQRLNYRMDIWFLSAMQSNTQVGIYSVASSISLFLLIRSRNSQRVLINKFKVDDMAGNDLLIQTEVSLLAKQMIGFSLLFIAGAYGLFRFLGHHYMEGFPVLMVLTVGIYMISVTMPYSAYFIYIHAPVKNLLAAGIGLLVNLGFNYMLIPSMGIWGAAVTSLLTYGAVGSVLYISYKRSMLLWIP
jgi:O-antigen/teichoic acid export membrane protein